MNSRQARGRKLLVSTFPAIAALTVLLSLAGCAAAFEAGKAAIEPNPATNEEVLYAVGQTATSDGGIKITLTAVYPFPESDFSSAENDFLLGIDVEINNDSEDDIAVSSLMSFDLQGTNGKTYSQSIFADVDSHLDATVRPGRKLVGTIVYDADASTDYYFAFKPDFIEDAIEFQITNSDWSE